MPGARLTPQLVVQEAARLSDEEGFAELTLAKVARHFGVAVPSLYKHVDGLAGLRLEVALLGVTELGDRLREAAVGRAGADALRAVADSYRRYALTHPGRHSAIQQAPALVGTGVLPVSTDPVEVLSSVLRGFAIPEEQHVHVIRGLRSALHGFVDLEITGGFGLPEDVETSFALLVEVFVRTLSDRSCDMAPWESKSTTRRD